MLKELVCLVGNVNNIAMRCLKAKKGHHTGMMMKMRKKKILLQKLNKPLQNMLR
jgi:hypothetical protein